MFGNPVTNRHIQSLRKARVIEIEPFIPENMGLIHFTLFPLRIKRRNASGKYCVAHDFSEDQTPFILEADEYVVVEIRERLKLLDRNIVGHFVPASNLIEASLGITVGKIDDNFGMTNSERGFEQEKIVFGVKNQLNIQNVITKETRLAHLVLSDLRGMSTEIVKRSEREISQREKRAGDDGVSYEPDGDDDE